MIPAENQIITLLRSVESRTPCLAPTILYNEGWLLRLVLSFAARGGSCLPFRFLDNSRWYSEAWLVSAFLPRCRRDPLAETHSRADAVVGHFHFADSKSGVTLTPECCQFVVCEAKMFSSLSAGTTHAPGFDQAARTVGCIAEILCRAQRPLDKYQSLGFVVFAPAAKLKNGNFGRLMTQDSIKRRIADRVQQYQDQPEIEHLRGWHTNWVLPLIDRMQIAFQDWESIITAISHAHPAYGAEVNEFYKLCLRYNSPPSPLDSIPTVYL